MILHYFNLNEDFQNINNSICHDNDSGRQGNVRESHKGSSRRYCEPENDETVANYNDDQLLDGGWTI